MSDSCGCPPEAGATTCRPQATSRPVRCPTNQQVGKVVDTLTVKAMLAVPLTQILPVEYRFCRDPNCPTVYYGVNLPQLFTEADLRERVYQKHLHEEDVFVCYCFRHTMQSIRTELQTTGKSTVLEAINAGIQAGQCACDIRNPQGSCCLGNVRAVVQRLQSELGIQPD